MKKRLTLLVSLFLLCCIALPVLAESLQLPGVGLQLARTNINVSPPAVNVPAAVPRVVPQALQPNPNLPHIVPPAVGNLQPVVPQANLNVNVPRPHALPDLPRSSVPNMMPHTNANAPNIPQVRPANGNSAPNSRPSTLLAPPVTTSLKTPSGDDVVIEKGAHVLVSRDGDRMRVQNLTGVGKAVKVQVGDRTVNLDAGTELVTGKALREEDLRPGDGIGRRNIKVTGDVAISEIDVRSVVAGNAELRRVVTRPNNREERRLGDHILKTIAGLLMVRGDNGFEQIPRPPQEPPVVANNPAPFPTVTRTQTENAAVVSQAANTAQQRQQAIASTQVVNSYDQTRPLIGANQPEVATRPAPTDRNPDHRKGKREIAQVPPVSMVAPPAVPAGQVGVIAPAPAAATSSPVSRPGTPSTDASAPAPAAATRRAVPSHPLGAFHGQLKEQVQKNPGIALALIILFGAMLAGMTALAVGYYKSHQEVRRLNRGLQAKLGELNELNEELTSTRDKAVEASRLKSQFVANISHEIRTPITAVLGMIGLLREAPRDEKDADLLKMLDESARSLLTVINDILDFSKIEAGMLMIQSIDFNTKTLAREVSELLAGQAKEKGLDLIVEVEPDADLTVHGDPYRVRQVLLNLIGNAIKFTAAGSVLLKVQREDDNMIGFYVKDTGIGIPEDARARLFQPFSQADGATTRRFGGTGLGLSISRRLVELMGGTIDFRSEPDSGSEFWFTIPFTAATTEAIGAIQPALPPVIAGGAHAGRRILVAEDSPVLQRIVMHQLKSLHYDVTLAKNGREAVEAIQTGAFDLVLMDWQMPELDGIQATREIRRMAQGASIPIVAMTANAMEGDRISCLEAGMNDYISKPFTLDELQKTIGHWLPSEETEATATQQSSENSQSH